MLLFHFSFPKKYADLHEIWYEIHTAGGHPDAIVLISCHHAGRRHAGTPMAPLNLEP